MTVKNQPSPKILIIGASWIGDMVMAQSLFITLKQQYPDCQIDVLAPKWTFALLKRMPEVSKAIEMPLGHGKLELALRMNLGKQLIVNAYDKAILLPNSWKSALIPFFAKIPMRTGYVGEARWGLLNDARFLNKTHLTKTVQRFVALAYPESLNGLPDCPTPRLTINSTQQQQVINKFKLSTTKPILALCPGAEYGIAKRWMPEYYADVASHYQQQGWQVWLFGSNKDQAVAFEINRQTTQQCFDFTGQTTIAEAIDLMALTQVVVSNDSGLMHIAAALDKPLIAIYGSSDPSFTPPLNEKSTILFLNLECSPCFKRECPLGHYHCLSQITPQQLIDVIGK